MKTKDMILIALFASMGISIKPFIAPIFNVITDLVFIPGGSSAGGIYMMFLTMGALIINKRHVAVYIGLLQGILAICMGISSFQGIFSLIVYSLPGVTIDLVLQLKDKYNIKSVIIIATALGNLTGSILTNFLFFNLKLVPATLFLSFAVISGSIGGILTSCLHERLKKSIKVEVKHEQ